MRAQKSMLQAGAVSKEPGSEAATKIEDTCSLESTDFVQQETIKNCALSCSSRTMQQCITFAIVVTKYLAETI